MNQDSQELPLTAMNSESPTPDIDQSSLAWKIFTAFVTDGQVSATEDELIAYANKDLNINVSSLPLNLVEALPLTIVAFMNMWSGWNFRSEFKAGKIKKEHYFNRFQKHMSHKMKITVNTNYNIASKALQESLDCWNRSHQNTNSDFTPYAISVKCPPHMLNTMVFSNVGDDVIMKQHLGSVWHELSTTQLLNWPYVEVSFRTPDICFVRRQATEFLRYLNFLPHEYKKIDKAVLEHVEFIGGPDRGRNCYTLRLLQEYVREYVQALKTVKDITGGKLEEILAIVTQFIEDVKLINVNASMVTNTLVLFRLSTVPFIRNKKLIKNTDKEGGENRVGYCEIITPKVQLVLVYFRGKQKNTQHISFETTDNIKSAVNLETSSLLPYIGYKCTFCKVEFDSSTAKRQMLDHLKNEHKMEQHVRCTYCKKQYNMLNLANCRWRHKCTY